MNNIYTCITKEEREQYNIQLAKQRTCITPEQWQDLKDTVVGQHIEVSRRRRTMGDESAKEFIKEYLKCSTISQFLLLVQEAIDEEAEEGGLYDVCGGNRTVISW